MRGRDQEASTREERDSRTTTACVYKESQIVNHNTLFSIGYHKHKHTHTLFRDRQLESTKDTGGQV